MFVKTVQRVERWKWEIVMQWLAGAYRIEALRIKKMYYIKEIIKPIKLSSGSIVMLLLWIELELITKYLQYVHKTDCDAYDTRTIFTHYNLPEQFYCDIYSWYCFQAHLSFNNTVRIVRLT